MSNIEQQYVTAYRNVILAVSDVNSYVTQPLADQIDFLERQISDESRIQVLRDKAFTS